MYGETNSPEGRRGLERRELRAHTGSGPSQRMHKGRRESSALLHRGVGLTGSSPSPLSQGSSVDPKPASPNTQLTLRDKLKCTFHLESPKVLGSTALRLSANPTDLSILCSHQHKLCLP